MALNVLFGTLSAEFKFNNKCSKSLIIMSSDEIYSLGLFTAGLQPLQASGIMSVAQTQPVRPVTHTFSYYAQYSAHESLLAI